MIHTFAHWWQTPGAGPLEAACALGGYALAVAGVVVAAARIGSEGEGDR